jgi:hypothetical protein
MSKGLAIFKQLIGGSVSIEYIGKKALKRTPGAVTEVSRN